LKIDKEKFYKKLFKKPKKDVTKISKMYKNKVICLEKMYLVVVSLKNFLLKIICLASKELISDKNKDFV